MHPFFSNKATFEGGCKQLFIIQVEKNILQLQEMQEKNISFNFGPCIIKGHNNIII
jgi:hypothetical protein